MESDRWYKENATDKIWWKDTPGVFGLNDPPFLPYRSTLTTRQLKDPETIEQGRIYDRILERCHPVEVTGYSMRRTILKEDFREIDNLLKGGDVIDNQRSEGISIANKKA